MNLMPHDVFACTQRAMPLSTSVMPIHVSDEEVIVSISVIAYSMSFDEHTSRNHLPFRPPLTQHGEKKSQRIRNRHSQRQLCKSRQSPKPLTKLLNKSHLTSLSNQQEKPHTPCDIQEQRHRISRILEQVNDRVQNAPEFPLRPWCV